MPRCPLIRVLLLAAAAALLSPATLPAQARAPEPTPEDVAPESRLADVEFKGGSVLGYVEALRSVYGPFNIVVPPEAGRITVPPVSFRHVTLDNALAVMNHVTSPRGTYPIEIGMDGNLWIIQVRDALQDEDFRATQVWSLRRAIELGMKAEDMLTAVETALALADDHVTMKFHPETALLIVQGSAGVRTAADEVIDRLLESAGSAADAAHERLLRDESVRRGKAAIEEAEQLRSQLASMQGDLAALRENMALEVERARLRVEQAEREAGRLRDALSAAGNQIDTLTGELAQLRAQTPRTQ